MPVDASIYNFTPYKFSTLADLADATAKRKGDELVIQTRQYNLNKAQREDAEAEKTAAQKAQEDAAIQAVFQKHTGPDGPDRKAIVNDLYSVSPTAAQRVETAFAKTLKEAADARKAELDNQSSQQTIIAKQLQGVKPETYRPVISMISAIDPKTAEFLGPNYDPAKVAQAIAAGTDIGEYNKEYKRILDGKESETTKALQLLSIAKTPEHVQDAVQYAVLHQVDKDLQAMGFDPKDPNIAQRANDYLLGPEKRATMAQQGIVNERTAASAAETARHNLVTERQGAQRIAQGGAGASGAGAGAGSNSDAVQEYAEGLKTGQINITAVPSAGGVRNAVMSSLRKEGYDLSRPLTAQTQARVEFSKAVLPQVQQVADMARQIDQMGLMGSVSGRWRQLISSEGAVSSLSNLTPDQKRVVGKFITQAGLLNSGMAMAHGGARGGGSVQMVAQMEKLLDPKNKDLQTFLGNLDAAQNVLGGYANIKVGNAADSGAPTAAAGSKTVTAAELQAIAKKRGTTVEQETQRFTAGGYTVR